MAETDAQHTLHTLSLAINCHEVNKVVWPGEGVGKQVLQHSPLFQPDFATRGAAQPKAANAMLDAMGLKNRDSNGIRLYQQAPMEIIVDDSSEHGRDRRAGTDPRQLAASASRLFTQLHSEVSESACYSECR